jgi:hypothetical protein
MKQLLTSLLLFIGLTCLAQPTYLDLTIQLDQYPPETAWVITQGADTVVVSPSYAGTPPSTLVEQRIFLNSNTDYTFTITDSFGDGICCGWGEGFFLSANNCEGIIFEDYEFNSSVVSYNFNLEPCEIPTSDITFRVNLANAPPEIETPGVLGSWNGWQVIPMEYDEGDEWFVTIPIQQGNYLWKFADFNNPNIQELPVGIDENSCFLFDGNGFINRTLEVIEGENQLLINYCWESCLPCGAIQGCSDPSAINWSPWANYDNGSCIVQNTDCPPGETFIEIVVTPDNFGGETSWKLFDDFGEVAAVNPGEYGGSPPGIPISTVLCVPSGVMYDLVIFDTYGDGLCGSCFGGTVIGNVQIFDCQGEELYNLQNEFADGNFGYDTVSDQFIPSECSGVAGVEGCTDFNYVEYNSEANIDDGSCLTQKIYGCLDETQFNYNPEANTEEVIESCEFTLTIKDGVGDGWFGSWLGIYQFGTIFGSPQYQMGPEDGTELSFNVSGLDATQPAYVYFFVTPQSIGTAQQCGFTLTNPEGEIIIDVPFFNIIPFINESGWYKYEINPYCGNTCEPYVYGCLDETAFNYVEEANTEDESCYYIPGCTSAGYLEYYTQGFEADFDNGDCQTLAVFGCMDPEALNFDPEANVSNEGCIPVIGGCTNPLAFNYNENANIDDGSCIAVEDGCTDPTAFNYDEEANTDDGSCISIIFGCTNPEALNFDPLANTDNGSCVETIIGCTDPLALNYNELANVEDGSCIDAIYGCTDPTSFNYNELANVDNGTCEEIIEGCMDPLALNFDPLANVNNFDCIEAIYGCTDSLAFNYNELANVDNGSCIEVIEGCTDPTAFNFNPEANTENFSCEPFIYGCTDPQAANYDEEANTDNGTCETVYANCIDSVVETYNLLELESECFAWVIDVSPSCCNNEWADGCQTIYNYCDENTVTNITEFGETQIIVFPNPTRDHINIASNLRINAVLYNSIGQPVLQETNVNQLDLSQFEAGIYNLILTHNDLQFTKKIIKQ